MIIGHVHAATISGNSISLKVPNGTKHTDGIQFYNTGTNDPMTNVVVQNNRIETHNQMSHGIYAANGLADDRGSSSTFFRNVTVDHNTVISGQVSGIAMGQTSGLQVTNNIILQDTSHRSSREILTPVIRVEKDSTGVVIKGNVTHKLPEASGSNWQPTDKSEPGWTISGNKLVSVGTSLKTAEGLAPSAGAGSTVKAAGAAAAATTVEAAKEVASAKQAAPTADGHADTFRFDAKGATDVVRNFAFGDHDQIVLHDYAKGTFHGQSGGNPLVITENGSMVKIDSMADLHELAKASGKVHVHEGQRDTLIINIEQPGHDHMIKILDMAHAYF